MESPFKHAKRTMPPSSRLSSKQQLVANKFYNLRQLKDSETLLTDPSKAAKELCQFLACDTEEVLIFALEMLSDSLRALRAKKMEGKLKSAFEKHGGLDLLEGLQKHSSQNVYENAFCIIANYWDFDG